MIEASGGGALVKIDRRETAAAAASSATEKKHRFDGWLVKYERDAGESGRSTEEKKMGVEGRGRGTPRSVGGALRFINR